MDSLQIVRWCVFGIGIVGIVLSISNTLFLLASVLCCLTLNMLPLKRKEISLNVSNVVPLSRRTIQKDDSNMPIIKHTISTYNLDKEEEEYPEKNENRYEPRSEQSYDRVIENMQKEIQRNELLARKKKIEERINKLQHHTTQTAKKTRFLGD